MVHCDCLNVMSRRIEPNWQCRRNESRTRDMPKPIPSAQPDHPAGISIGAFDMFGSTINYFCGSMCDTHKPVGSDQQSSCCVGYQRNISCRPLGQVKRRENCFTQLIEASGGRDPDAAFPILYYLKAEIAGQSIAFRKALHGGVCWTVMANQTIGILHLQKASTDSGNPQASVISYMDPSEFTSIEGPLALYFPSRVLMARTEPFDAAIHIVPLGA